LDNLRIVSCIPRGVYRCQSRWFFRGGYEAIEITEVPNRTHILFHKANSPQDVSGCIGVGSKHGCFNEAWGIPGGHSKPGFDRLMEWFGGHSFNLRVVNVEGLG
jgi:hypothetical protein